MKLRRNYSSIILNLNPYRFRFIIECLETLKLGLIFIDDRNLTKVTRKHSQYRHLLLGDDRIIRDISFQRHFTLRRCPLLFTTFPRVSDDDNSYINASC